MNKPVVLTGKTGFRKPVFSSVRNKVFFCSTLLAVLLGTPDWTQAAKNVPSSLYADSVSEFCTRLEPLGRILETPGWFVWCVAPILDDSGRVHVFYSRWAKELGMGGWLKGCEIAHAVADQPEGPYRYLETVLSPRPGFWDATTCHNPHIQHIDSLYYLFYMGNSNGKTNTKRIGVATSKSLYGPWTRSDKPLLEPGPKGSWDDHCTTNPAFLKAPDGTCRLYYKSWNDSDYINSTGAIRGNRKYGLACSDRPEGPYRKYEGNPVVDFSVLGGNKQAEDAYVWRDANGYHLLMRDMGVYNHTAGLYLESADGIHWNKPRIAWYGLNTYLQEAPPPPSLKRYGRLERPQLMFQNGKPAFLFLAAQGGAYGTASGFVFKIKDN